MIFPKKQKKRVNFRHQSLRKREGKPDEAQKAVDRMLAVTRDGHKFCLNYRIGCAGSGYRTDSGAGGGSRNR